METFIFTFSEKLMKHLLETGEIEVIDEEMRFGSAASTNPVCRIAGTDIGVFLSGIGGMMAGAMIEEISAAFRAKNFIVFGSCGVLKDIPEGRLILPTEAYRDEGFSYHYAPACDFIEMKNADRLSVILDELEVGYVRGRVWTTDAFYRETDHNRDRRVEEGCVCVEMECSALQAVCDFRGLELYHFLYGADSLNGSWQKRILGNLEMDSRIAYYHLAKQIAMRL